MFFFHHFSIRRTPEKMPSFYEMPSMIGTPALGTDIDTSISTGDADGFYTGPFPGPKYIGFKSSMVEGVAIPASFRGAGASTNNNKDRMDG